MMLEKMIEVLQETIDMSREFDGDLREELVSKFFTERDFAERVTGKKIVVRNWKVMIDEEA